MIFLNKVKFTVIYIIAILLMLFDIKLEFWDIQLFLFTLESYKSFNIIVQNYPSV